ncbi:hypothetical protein [Hymenobacter sp.]|uniref:hypothetical protein n=1 Tax=Hymenobacter sp. TaxID=1898978 RepID=UPI00286B1E79|nr:hypothetical protein [Hymenobacter sp.]
MKLFLLATCFIVGMATARAQTPAPSVPPAPAGQPTGEYCQVMARSRLNGRFVVSIDYGQQQKVLSANLFRDTAGNAVEFNSPIDALNWLNAQGWELISTFVLSDNSAYYVLRRRPA